MEEVQQDRLSPQRSSHAYHPLRLLAAALAAEASGSAAPVVDIGCGAKPYSSLFPPPYIGLDVQPSHGRPDILAAAERLPLRAGSAGTVVSTQQLEHVDDPRAVLTESRRVLADGGRLLLSTHGVWAHHPDPRDLWRWTEEGLIELITSAGFHVERTHRLGGPVLAGALLAAYPLAGVARTTRGAKRVAAATTLRAMNAIVWPIDRAVARRAPRHYGSVGYLVVATAS